MCLIINNSVTEKVLKNKFRNSDTGVFWKIILKKGNLSEFRGFEYKCGWNIAKGNFSICGGYMISGGAIHVFNSREIARDNARYNKVGLKIIKVYINKEDYIKGGLPNESCAKKVFVKSLRAQ